jgi:hypothetical protein
MVDASSLIKDTRFVEISENEILLKNEKTQQAVSIDRRTYAVSKKSNVGSTGSNLCTFPIQGVYGIIDLASTKYLILITAANYVGEILSKKIFQIEKLCYVPLDRKIAITSSKNLPFAEEDRTYIEMLDNFFSKKFLYFSYDYDLTRTLQTFCLHNLEKGKWNSQYFFNEIFMQEFIKNGLEDWIAPVISGIVEIKHLLVNQNEFDFILISRRDKRRSGMRFVSRGCDLDGNCSNTADTEQIAIIYKKNSLETKVFSYVQLRASMPFLWNQKPTLKWEPLGNMTLESHNVEVAKKHFDKMVKDYGNQVMLNLVDKKRTQQKLGLEFQRVVEENSKNEKDKTLRFVWFDFHQECRKMKYENLSRLLTLVETDTTSMGMFEAEIKKANNGMTANVIQTQKGTFRTNCMDCLDRTNVVQSVIGRKLLHFALIHSKLSDKSLFNLGPFEKLPDELENAFREIWTKNADALSILYTGTGALKTDFTRTGKRSKQGALNDGKNSIMRYVKNNFYDGYNQNCIDLALGKYKPKETAYKKQKINNFFILGFMLIATPIFIKLVLDTLHAEIFEQNTHHPQGRLKAIIFYITVFGLSFLMLFKAVKTNPHKFIETPILKQ